MASLALASSLVLAACGSSTPASSSNGSSSESSTSEQSSETGSSSSTPESSAGGDTSSAAGASSFDPSKTTIGFVVGASSDPFFIAMKKGAQEAATAAGVKLIFQGDATTYSPATQIPIVNQVLAQNPTGFALAPTDPDALQSAVNDAIAKGIPVVNVDSSVKDLSKVLAFITGDNEQGGQAAADAMAKAIGYQNGKTYQVVAGLTSASTTTNTARLDGFKKEIAAKYPGIKLVATGYSQSNSTKANSNVNNWLTAYPNLAGIFAIDGTNATGAAAALQAKGLVGKVALVGYDAYKNNVDLLKQGVFTALIAQDPVLEGQDAVNDLVQYLKNGNNATGIDKAVTLPVIVLTKDSSAADLAKYTYPAS